MKTKTLAENSALELMRKGSSMLKMHTVYGMQWFIAREGSDQSAPAPPHLPFHSATSKHCLPVLENQNQASAPVAKRTHGIFIGDLALGGPP